jgi:hypothetical protein
MPKNEIDYSNTIIYKITCNDSNITDKYVGHTTNFVQRKYAHKDSCVNEKSSNHKCKLYETIRQNGGWSNWKMEIINFFNCKDHYEARIKEQEYFVLLNANLNSIEPVPNPKPKIKNVIESKIKQTIYCETCKVNFTNLKLLEIHNTTKKHLNKTDNITMVTKNTPKPHCFSCDTCCFISGNKKDYTRHLTTPKHLFKTQMVTNLTEKPQPILPFICDCGNTYKYNSGLSRHKKKCLEESGKINTNQIQQTNQTTLTTDVILKILKQNEELQKMLVDQSSKILELAKEGKNIINNTNNTTNNFNLNLFLNEKCKDALNITEFVNSLVVNINDLEETARLGYAEGISKIFINGLKQLDIYKRPIHCSDLKREVIYIKDQDNWEKDDDKIHLLQAIKVVGNKNIKQISEWQKVNPQFKDPESKQNDKYLSMLCNVMSGGSKEETTKNYDKIVRNIVKETVIEK